MAMAVVVAEAVAVRGEVDATTDPDGVGVEFATFSSGGCEATTLVDMKLGTIDGDGSTTSFGTPLRYKTTISPK